METTITIIKWKIVTENWVMSGLFLGYIQGNWQNTSDVSGG